MSRRSLPLTRLPDLLLSGPGLSTPEAHERQQRYGTNDIVEVPGDPWWDLARDTAKDPMIWFFAGTSALYALVGQRAEALTLLAAILPLVAMDAYLHRRTQASIEGLQGRLATKATVTVYGEIVRSAVRGTHPRTALLVFQELPATQAIARFHTRSPARFFSGREWLVIALIGALTSALVAAGYLRSLEGVRNVEHGRAMALATLTLTSAGVTATLSRLRTWTAWLICTGTVGLSAVLIQTPPLADLLHLEPLHPDDWGLALLGASVVACLPLILDALAGRRDPAEREASRGSQTSAWW